MKSQITGVLAIAALLLLANCSSSRGDVSKWVENYLDAEETLLCEREVNGEYFFLARNGDVVKFGSRLNMTDYPANHTLIIAWMFQNERGNYLAPNVPPRSVRQQYVKVDERTYAENVRYQTLRLSESNELRVRVEIKKCFGECDRQGTQGTQGTQGSNETSYTIAMCNVMLNQQGR